MRMELANAIRGRYVASPAKDKRKILDEFVAATGYHEKSAIRIISDDEKSSLMLIPGSPTLESAEPVLNNVAEEWR